MSIYAPNIEAFGSPVYPISPDENTNVRISAVLNEAEHVFAWHAEGLWESEYKDGFARLLIPYFKQHPKLISNINETNNRIFSMVVYRAVELLGKEAIS